MTFSTLQTLTNNSGIVMAPVADYANDDISVAKRLAEQYEKQGLDPKRAYDSPDDALQDFGGINGLI